MNATSTAPRPTSALAGLAISFAVALAPAAAAGQTAARVATWNLQSVGPPGSIEYEAALDVLQRIGPDVIGLNEVASQADIGHLTSLANDAGYPHVVVAQRGGPFGALRNALLASTWPIVRAANHSSASVSGDQDANDLTRDFLEVEVGMPEGTENLVVLVEHWKSGTGDDNEFRRAVESTRISQVTSMVSTTSAIVVLGDVNEEADSVPRNPAVFTSVPNGLPASFSLGADLVSLLASQGIPNDPFAPLTDVGLDVLDALQLDGLDATRPSSGRRLDYLMVSATLAGSAATEVYDSTDEGLGGGLPKYGAAPVASTSADASDHFLVFADVTVPADGEPPVCHEDGSCEPGEDCDNCAADCGGGSGSFCGDGVCAIDEGEDCASCAADCRGKQRGNQRKRFCCGYGGDGPVGCADSRCTEEGFSCVDGPQTAWCCGDGACDSGEDSCVCGLDCGAAPAAELSCVDGEDEDCDGLTDCADPDCAAACVPACDGDGVCEAGEDCSNCGSDCAGVTKGKPTRRHCCGDGVLDVAEGNGAVCDGNP